MTQQEKYLEASRRRLEEAALQYARMKIFRFYLDENNCKVQMCQSDQLLMAAENLLHELSMDQLPERNPS